MRTIIVILSLCVMCFPHIAQSCEGVGDGPYRFLDHPAKMDKSATTHGTSVTIDTSFLEKLIASPSYETYWDNDRELFYLLSIGNSRAEYASARLLAFFIKNPRYGDPCDGKKQEVYGIEELAFNFSRNDFGGLCRLPLQDQELIVGYYNKNPRLAVGFDRPKDFRDLYQECH